MADHLGSVRKIVDKDGNVVSSLKYSAFGELVTCAGMRPRFRYAGKFFDDVTGLQWNINRWYDAKVGRWASEDPIGFDAKDANLYRYVGNEAVGKVDFLGFKKHVYAFEGFGGYLGISANPILTDIVPIVTADPDAESHYYPQNQSLLSLLIAINLQAKTPNSKTCRYDTIVLVGHSYGGDKVHELAHALNIKIDLVFTIDPVAKWTADTTPALQGAYGFTRSANSSVWENYYQRRDTASAVVGGVTVKVIWGDVVVGADKNSRPYALLAPFAGAHMSIVPRVAPDFAAALARVAVDRPTYR